MDMLSFLETVDLFKGMRDDQIEAIQPCCEPAEIKRGERIFREGEDARYLYVVMEGQVELREEGNEGTAEDAPVISNLFEGNAFGWSTLVSPYKYYLSAYSTSRTCKVLKIERERFTKLIEANAGIGYPIMTKILALIGRRFDELEEKVIKRLGHEMIGGW